MCVHALGWLATENLHLPLYVKIARRNTAQLSLCVSLTYLPFEMNGPTPRLYIYTLGVLMASEL